MKLIDGLYGWALSTPKFPRKDAIDVGIDDENSSRFPQGDSEKLHR